MCLLFRYISEGKIVSLALSREFYIVCCRSINRRSIFGRSDRSASLYSPGAYIVVPTALILACVNVERDCHLLACLYVELRNLVGSEYIETYSSGILLMSLQYVLLRFPLVTGFRNTASLRQYSNDFSCNFHISIQKLKFKIKVLEAVFIHNECNYYLAKIN